MVKTLKTLFDLKNSGFGWPYPRHGLNLLYWFANRCVEVSYWNLITVLHKPETGAFGFRRFHNSEGLLPATNLPYYEVGNLSHDEAKNLPPYVRAHYSRDLIDSNVDRIIICTGSFTTSVYVTSHRDQWNFDPNRTYELSPKLLKSIRRMEREDFLKQTTSFLTYIRQGCKTLCHVVVFLTILVFLFMTYFKAKDPNPRRYT